MKSYQELLGRTNCPVCKSDKLKVISVIDQDGVPPGEPEHNIGYNHIMLAHCQSCGSGLVERLDHDCFDHDSVFDQYEWYILSKTDLRKLLEAVQACPDTMSPKCDCAIHHSLRSSMDSLPTDSWHWAFEDDRHVHKILLKWAQGLPVFEVTED